MGQCHSQPSGVTFDTQIKASGNAPSSSSKPVNNNDVSGEKPKLTIIVAPHGGAEITSNDVEDPLTGRTAAETPPSVTSSPLNMSIDLSEASSSSMPSLREEEHDHEEEELLHASQADSGLSLSQLFQSLRHTEELDPVIPEEVDPDAPSDEEDELLFQQQQQVMARKLQKSTKKTKPTRGATTSPPRPQDCVKMQHRHITNPNSVIHRHAPESNQAVPPGAVSSHHISEFRKLKVQVKLAARQERKKARIAKLEDRYDDVRGYNHLWQNFQEIRGRAETKEPANKTLKRSNSFDLHDTDSWFFDFQSFDEEDGSCCYDYDDDMSQSSLSLHSTTSMESQRRYFKEKREGRLSSVRRHNADTNLLLMNQIIHTQARKAVKDEVLSPIMFSPNHHEASASTPPSILRGIAKNESAMTTPAVSELGTPESRGPVAPRVNAFQIATGQPEYHVYKRPGEKPVDHDEDTPKAKSRRTNASYTEPHEEDMNNDYQVARRRRVASFHDADASIHKDDERAVAESLGIQLPPSPQKQQRNFDYSSFCIQVVTTDTPNVQVTHMTPKENDNMNRKERVVTGNAARCLEETFAGNAPGSGRKKTRPEKDAKDYGRCTESTIATMSTEDFLRFSDSHALVNVTNNHGHEIHLESSSSLDDKENDTSVYEGMADDVNEQIDFLLAKYRDDNEDAVIPNDVSNESIEQEP